MNKAVQLSMVIAGIVVTVCLVALIVFVATFNINDYKDRISQAVVSETGRTLEFRGDLSLTFFPRLGVRFGGVSLSNAEGFGAEPMAQIDSAMVSVRLLPLLKGEILFGRLELNGLVLNLLRNEAGVTNWDDLIGREEKPQPSQAKQENNKFSLEIDGVAIKDARLVWADRYAKRQFVVHDFNIETGQINRGVEFPVTGNLSFESSSPDVKGTVSLSGKSSIDLRSREYRQMDMKMSLAAEGSNIPGGSVQADMGIQLAVFDLRKETAHLTGVTANAYGATMQMDGSFEGLTKGLKKIVATVTVSPCDLKKTLAAMGLNVPETVDASALTAVGGMAQAVYAPGDLEVETAEIDLDGTRIVGNGRVKDNEDGPFYMARLDVGTLDLDRYLPPEHGEKASLKSESDTSGQGEAGGFDVTGLRRLNLDVEVGIAELRVKKVALQKVKAAIKAKDGVIRIDPLTAELYGGSMSIGSTVNAAGNPLRSDIIFGLHAVDVGQLARDATGETSIAGHLNLNGALSCSGTQAQAMLRSLDGKIGFDLADGIFPGVDLMRMVRTTHANKEKRDGTVEAAETDSTKFGSIAGTGVITSGVLKNHDLEVKAPGLRADGEGSVVLPTRQLDYLLKVKLTPLADGQGGKSSSDLIGVLVPIHVSGTLDDPHYWVSITEYIKALGGAVIGVAGSIIGGVTDVITGVGKAVVGGSNSSKETTDDAEPKKRKKFLGIF